MRGEGGVGERERGRGGEWEMKKIFPSSLFLLPSSIRYIRYLHPLPNFPLPSSFNIGSYIVFGCIGIVQTVNSQQSTVNSHLS